MAKYEVLAKEIVKNIGGKENVSTLTHCITRLRFKLKDESLAKDEVLKQMNGIVAVMKSGGQYQVIIGNHVGDVYADVMTLLGGESSASSASEPAKEEKLLSRFIDVVSGIFQPILGIMAACGMIKGFNTLFAVLGLYPNTCGFYQIINAVGDALFTFLPLFLGYTSAKKFGLKPMIGLAIGGILCYPAIQGSALAAAAAPLYTLFAGTMFASPVYIEFFGIPVVSMDYTSTVIPVIFVVYFASHCDRLFQQFVPDLVKFFFVPMLTLLAALPLGFLLLGPIAVFGSTFIADIILGVRDLSPMLAGALVGLTWQILVIFGLHWGFIPIYINNIVTNGYDNVMMPFFACTFAASAVILAIFFKAKDQKLKEMCLPNFISGIFGVTEPAIYGILLPLKRPLVLSCIAGGIGGAFYGAFNFRKFMMGGMGIFEFPAMVEPNGAMGNLIVAVSGVILTMVVAFALTMIFYREADGEEKTDETEKPAPAQTETLIRQIQIASPLKGRIIELKDVEDAAFASGILGKGAAIAPDEGKVFAPVNGTVSALFPTKHAIGITSEDGVELLIHVGLNTVQLNGEGFEAKVAQGDKVTKGQELLDFDIELIRSKGFCLETPVIVSNSGEYLDVLVEAKDKTSAGDTLLHVIQ